MSKIRGKKGRGAFSSLLYTFLDCLNYVEFYKHVFMYCIFFMYDIFKVKNKKNDSLKTDSEVILLSCEGDGRSSRSKQKPELGLALETYSLPAEGGARKKEAGPPRVCPKRVEG